MDRDSFLVYIKTVDTYQDIVEDFESRVFTSNYELDRPLPKGKIKKNWINEKLIRWINHSKICWIERKNL